jgi:hypothetical protein
MFVLSPSLLVANENASQHKNDDFSFQPPNSAHNFFDLSGNDVTELQPLPFRQPIRSRSTSYIVDEGEDQENVCAISQSKLPVSSSSSDIINTAPVPCTRMSDAGRPNFSNRPLHLESVIPNDEEIKHVIDAFYVASQAVFSRSILIIVSISESPLFSTPHEGQEWVNKQKQSFTCPPSFKWNEPLSIGDPSPPLPSAFVNGQYQSQRRGQGGTSLHSQTGLVLLSKLLPSQRVRRAIQQHSLRLRSNPSHIESVQLKSDTVVSDSLSHSDSFSTMASALTSAAVATAVTPSATRSTSAALLDGTQSKASMIGEQASNISATSKNTNRTENLLADDEGSYSSSEDESEEAEDVPVVSTRGKNWIQSHLQGQFEF